MEQTKILGVAMWLTLVCPTLQITINAEKEPVYLWPMPKSVVWGKISRPIPLSPMFQIVAPNHKNLQNAVSRYSRLVFTDHWFPIESSSAYDLHTSDPTVMPPLEQLNIRVQDLDADLQHGVDESYTLTIPAGGEANLTARTAWGAMRGLETFSQLLRRGSDASVCPIIIPRPVKIFDGPLYPHRGILLDTGRNFYTVKDILRTIRAMSYNKLNVFHWHITDSQSFPLDLPSEPALAQKGAYSSAMRYSQRDVRDIVEYGRNHGVRVVPEIDTPGHSASWAEAYPDIVACAGMFWWNPNSSWSDRLASEPGAGQLNPLNPKTFEVVRNVVDDVASLFPEDFFHAGSDEVVPGCWKTDPAIQKFVAKGGTLDQLLEKFVSTTHPYITSRNKTAVYWEDVLLDDTVKVRPEILPRETTILQTWNNGPNNTKLITAAGYRAIVSSADFFLFGLWPRRVAGQR
uniref:beta-N-acetylhexosaminidase n=1 Tax=Araucaria cunninghamii TaxID=56994 RepID=A0A0D6QY62_ARACU